MAGQSNTTKSNINTRGDHTPHNDGGNGLSPGTKKMLRYFRALFSLLFSALFYIAVVMVIGTLSGKAYDFTYEIFGSQIMEKEPGHEVLFTITQGESTSEIAEQLAYNRLVAHARTFYIRAKLTIDDEHPILPGTYALNTSMDYQEILNVITDGKAAIAENEGEQNGD